MFIRIADKNIRMGVKYGKIAVTAVGMYSREPFWFIPHRAATVLVIVGSLSRKVVKIDKTHPQVVLKRIKPELSSSFNKLSNGKPG